ncbi:hypothetical protein PIB30_054389 [Stylosanthes scabra]|uniref:Replication factor A C-terminal domain-containing protein n=1 Tax=Stylosanthes scabra TaxID=79078 RepID=A0ABU6UHR4_9FABA|nr:hypothetical protein [Stylosanthes scabra]
MPLVHAQGISAEEDFLRLSVYKSIGDIKEHNQEVDKKYFCPKCIQDYGFYVPRYSIHVSVIDHMDAASFVLFDREASKFLGQSANELRQSYIAKDLLVHENSELVTMSTGPYDQSKEGVSQSILSEYGMEISTSTTNEKQCSKILGTKKYMDEEGDESIISSKNKKMKWVVTED